jgi:predicted enzyme related to lactoylglutathione lyase
MPTRDAAPIGAPCWVDLMTSDTDQATAFYGELFGWTAEAAGEEYGGYINFSKDGVQVAGCMASMDDAGMPDVWSVYLASADAKATGEVAEANGGQVLVPAMDVGELGVMAVLLDAGQAAIGIWQPGLHKGFGILAESGAPAWFELHTRDYDASVQFYKDVFDWDAHAMSDSSEFRYTTLGEGDGALAGIMDASAFLPDGVPAGWAVYFGVDSADATVAKITELGGSIVHPAEDTPYGRLATAADTTGAIFKVVENNL